MREDSDRVNDRNIINTRVGRKFRYMPTLDLYILREFLIIYVCLTVAFCILFLANDLINKLGELLATKASFATFAYYFLLEQPTDIQFVLPLTILLSAIYTLARLGMNNEITAIRASGVSLLRCGVSLYIVGLIVSGVSFYFSQTLVPNCIKEASIVLNSAKDPNYIQAMARMLVYRTPNGQRTWLIKNFVSINEQTGIQIKKYNSKGILKLELYAGKAIYSPVNGWKFFDVKIVRYEKVLLKDDYSTSTLGEQQALVVPVAQEFAVFDKKSKEFSDLGHFFETPADFLNTMRSPHQWTSSNIRGLLSRAEGLSTEVKGYYQTILYSRWFSPWICLLCVFLAIPLAASNERRGVIVAVGSAVGVVIIYQVMTNIFMVLGQKAYLPPIIAGTVPTIALAIFVWHKMSKYKQLKEFRMAKGTVTQKILESHITAGKMKPGDKISLKIDQTLTQDATGTMAYLELEAMGIDRVKTELSVSYVDHNTLQNGPENRNDHLYLQTIASSKGVKFSRPGNGICHQVHLERFGIPGKTLLGSDSHTPTNGGIGMIAIGAGGLDVALAMAGKSFQMTFPKIIGIKLKGKLAPWVTAKDIILKVLDILKTKGNVGCVVEYFGPGVRTLSVPERATITNMGAELGVTFSIFPSDEKTKFFLEAQKRGKVWKEIIADDNSEYDKLIEIDLNVLEPLAACPSSPDNIKTIRELGDKKIDQIVIGSCTNGSLLDLMLVANMLKGKKISQDVTLAIAPGSRQVMETLAREGALADIIAAGARILESTCGPCIGQGQSPSNDSISLRTFNRNFAGRTGTKGDQAYLVSPAVAVAAALTGQITDPRNLKIKFPDLGLPTEFLINDNMIVCPVSADKASSVEVIRKPTIGKPPLNPPLPNNIDGSVLLKVGDKITTDHIMPAGIYLKLRSNIPAYSKVVFECFYEYGKHSFAERAEQIRDSGRHGVIVAGESYGQGSSREHAAICPMYLGVKAVIAITIERIHSANLINFGIIPFTFNLLEDYDSIEQGDTIRIDNIRDVEKGLKPFSNIAACIVKRNGSKNLIQLKHALNSDEIEIILAGGRLNM